MDDSLVAFEAWYDAADLDPPVKPFCEAFTRLVNDDKKSLQTVVETVCKAVPKVVKSTKSRSDFAIQLVNIINERPKALSALWEEATRRTTQVWSTPDDQVFFFVLMCELYMRDEKAAYRKEESLCVAMERCYGKTRPAEAASRFHQVLKHPGSVWEKFEKAALSHFPLASKSKAIRSLCGFAVETAASPAALLTAYVDAIFTSKGHLEEDVKKTTWAFTPLLKSLSSEDVATYLSAPVGRALRLTTEKSLPASILLCETLDCNVIPEDCMLMPALKALRTSSKENVQEMSSKLVGLCLFRASEASCGGVMKELCDEIPREGSLFRREKMIRALSTASSRSSLVWSKMVFSTLLRRGKDEKVEEMRSLCFHVCANWVSPNLVNESLEADAEAILSSVCPLNLAGIQLIRVVASCMKISQSTQDAAVKALEKIASAADVEPRMKLHASDALLALGQRTLAARMDLRTVDQQNEADCLAAVRILSRFSPNDQGCPPKYYIHLARLLANTNFATVHQEAQTVCSNRVVGSHLEKQMFQAVCSASKEEAFVLNKFAVEAMLPPKPDQCDSEHLGLALILSFRCVQKDRKTIWSSILKRRFLHDARHDSFRFAAPFLFAPNRDIDADALCEALHLDPQVAVLEPYLLDRLNPARIMEVTSEENIAAYSAPPGRLSDYRQRLLDQQAPSDDEDEGEDSKTRMLRQGRKGRGGARKEIYSAENEEWERKIRAEQKEKAKQQQQQPGSKDMSTAEQNALRVEQELRNKVEERVHIFSDGTKALVAISRRVPHVCQAMSDKALPLALSLTGSPLVRTSANAILDAYLSLVFSHDKRLSSEVKAQLRKTKDANPFVLVQLNDICRESLAPLAKDLFELVFPVILRFASHKEAMEDEEEEESSFRNPLDDKKDEITDAMFNLLSLHHTLITRSKREVLLPGLLHVVSQTPVPSSLDCVVSLFSVEKPSESEIAVLVGDDGLLHSEPAVRLTALTALKSAEPSATLTTYFWFASSDTVVKNRNIAEVLSSKLDLPSKYYETLGKLLSSKKDHVRLQAARAISAGIDEHPNEAASILSHSLNLYRSTIAEIRSAAQNDKPQIKFFERNSSHSRKDAEPDPSWYSRSGIAFVLSAFAGLETDKDAAAAPDTDEGLAPLGPVFEPKEALTAIEFVLSDGTRDPHPTVRAQMLSAGTSLLQAYGPDLGETLISLVQSYLEKKAGQKDLKESEISLQQEGAVILLGAAASNLPADDNRVPGIATKLVSALETPSETVQRASVRILPQLMKSSRFKPENGGDGGRDLVELCLSKALSASTSVASRKGHAMGLAALIKGVGISSLKTFSIVPRLTEASASEKWEVRQGSLFCFQELTESLGRLFEPYVVQIVEPVLLKSFSDEKVDVRDAAHDASKNVMANLSGPGVSMLLPKLLSGIASIEWRTKQAAILMLGSVAFCAPKQLSSSLPQVVPKLIDSFTDTHPKVRAAAVSALKDVQSVVKNPEIEKISFALIAALTDPHERTKDAVDVLFQTRFIHAVDAPSLALLVPILRRGLKERSTETKKKAALIVGNMISMISDAKAVKPYLEDLLPVLKVVLVDPIPGVRGTAAKALGTLVRGLGPEGIPDFAQLFQFLIDTMLTGMSSVERQGGAQGFVEVLVALQDPEALDTGLRKEIFERASSPTSTPSAREGALWGLVFLPTALENVSTYAERALNCALNALADDTESVRDAALRCSRVYVAQFTLSEPNIVMSALETGMAHLNWRVKQTAVRLLGDFVASLQKEHWNGAESSFHAPPPPAELGEDDEGSEYDEEEEEDDEEEEIEEKQPRGPGAAAAAAAAAAQESNTFSEGPADAVLLKLFGAERRDALIATVYLLRSDSSSQVRQNALFVWKSIVSNTPRTMKRIVKALMQNVIQLLSSTDPDRQKVGGKALADIVRKLGDRVLPEIVPVVSRGLDKENEAERIGVAMGLYELVGATSKGHLEPQADSVLSAILKGLCDENNRVRDLAGKTFNRVHVLLGAQVDGPATTFVLSRLCADLPNDEERCTRGLTQAVESRSRDCLTFLLPRLLNRPLQAANVRALASCMSVVPTHLHHYLRQITRSLVQELAAMSLGPPEDTGSEIWQATVACFSGSVSDEQAVSTLLVELADLTQNSTEASYRRAAMAILAAFLSNTEDLLASDLGAAVGLKTTIRQFAETDPAALSQAGAAFAALVKHVGAADMTHQVDFIRNSVRTVASMDKHRPRLDKKEGYELPAFSLKICADAILEVYQYALMNGSNEERESAAEGLGELVDLTYSETLKPYVVKITGPLIRIVGDRFPSSVKSAILDTLRKLLMKGGAVLRPFLPQLQTTFVKALQNSAENVRSCGFRALQVLVPLSPRVDPLCSELVQGCASADAEIRLNMVKALLYVLSNRLTDVSLAGLTKILEKTSPLDACVSDWQEPTVRIVSAAVEGKALEGLLLVASDESQALQDAVAERLRARLRACTDESQEENNQARHGALLSLDAALRLQGGAAFVAKSGIDPIEVLQEAARDETPHVRAVVCDAAGWALLAKDKFGASASALNTMLQQAMKNDADSMVRGVAEVSLTRKSEMYSGAVDRMEAELA